MLSQREVERYLARIAQIKETHDLIDIHVHPFEVIFNNLQYKKPRQVDGVYSSSEVDYRPPRPAALEPAPEMSERCKALINENLKARCLLLSMRQLYLHTGPRVFADHMEISGLAKVLLLPVMGAEIENDDQMALMINMFGQNDDRFIFGYCVPNGVENGRIETAVNAAVQQYKVKALKIHPAVTGINLDSQHGVERIECMLRSCRENGLSVIVHGGRSPAAKTAEFREYSVLSNLQKVNWSLAGKPVVIAHAGAFGYNKEDLLETVIPRLCKIMAQHDNVLADISGLEFPTLCSLLCAVEAERIVFGSDCLYYPQWRTIVSLFHALNKTITRAEEAFVKITSHNPSKTLGCA